MLEEVADRAQVALAGDAPDAGADREGEHDGTEGGGADPPPRAEPVAIAEAGGADGRPRADVGRDHGREHEPRAQGAAGHEEVARALHAPPDGEADRDQEERVGEEQREVKVHGRG